MPSQNTAFLLLLFHYHLHTHTLHTTHFQQRYALTRKRTLDCVQSFAWLFQFFPVSFADKSPLSLNNTSSRPFLSSSLDFVCKFPRLYIISPSSPIINHTLHLAHLIASFDLLLIDIQLSSYPANHHWVEQFGSPSPPLFPLLALLILPFIVFSSFIFSSAILSTHLHYFLYTLLLLLT